MINVIGLGYIGLPTSLILAANGNKVVGTDIDVSIVKKLNNNQLSFTENGLEELFFKSKENKIEFTTKPVNADAYIITVPTPYLEETKKTDMSYVQKAVKDVLAVNEGQTLLIIESTVSPGAIDESVRPMLRNYPQIKLVHAPERILPGSMVSELVYNSRTIGADSIEIAKEASRIYETFCKSEIVLTDIKTAEMSKVVENTYRDINIAFANELAIICDKAGLDVYEVIEIANKHPRVDILSPGPGVGGHCIPIDPWFLVGSYPNDTNIILKARMINESIPSIVLSKIEKIMKENDIQWSEVGIYGLAYKENVDDLRESPTIQLLKLIKEKRNKVKVFDHKVSLDNQTQFNPSRNWEEFEKDIKLLVVMVNHDELNGENLEKFEVVLDTKSNINGSNVVRLWGIK